MPPLDTPSLATATAPMAVDDFAYIAGLDGDTIRVALGDVMHLDVGSNAVLTTDNGLIDELLIYDSGGSELSLDEAMIRVTASDGLNQSSVISIDGVPIGTVQSAISGGSLDIIFNLEATTERVQALLHAITYKAIFPGPDPIEERRIEVHAFSGDEYRYADVYVTVAPAGAFVLTRGIDVVTGTAIDDVIHVSPFGATAGDEIDGGGGNDTLLLVNEGNVASFELDRLQSLSSVETIEGSSVNDGITLRGDQLAGIQTIDGKGGQNYLKLAGSDIDLTGKTVLNFHEIELVDDNSTITLDNAEIAKLLAGYWSDNDKLILTSGILTAAERLALHRRGIDTIVAKETENGEVIETSQHVPSIAALNGDHVTANGAIPVFIDAGRNAIVTADGGIHSLSLYLENADIEDRLGVDLTGSVRLSDGLFAQSQISVGSVANGFVNIGQIEFDVTSSLTATFNEAATPALVQEFLHALTYANTANVVTTSKNIFLYLIDLGRRETMVSFSIDPPQVENRAPTSVDLAGRSVLEGSATGTVIGTLAGTDPDPLDTLTFSLPGDAQGRFALQGNKLVVADGVRLDYEQATSHSITVRVTDAAGLYREETFLIAVNNVDVVESYHLNHDSIRMAPGQSAPLDVGSDVILASDSGLIDTLDLYFGNSSSADDHFGYDPLFTRVAFSDGLNVGSVVSVDGFGIGAISDQGDPRMLSFDFNSNGTTARVQELLRSLTYQNTSTDLNLVAVREISVLIGSGGESEVAGVTFTIAPNGVKILTPGMDVLTGTPGDDIFHAPVQGITAGDQINGGGGNDLLKLSGEGEYDNVYFDLTKLHTLSGIETIEGAATNDFIEVRGDELVGVEKIDGKGGFNSIFLHGTTLDITGMTVENFERIALQDDNAVVTVDDAETAKVFNGWSSANDTLTLTAGILTAAERLALHRKGIDTIVAEETLDGVAKSTTFHAPVVAALDGDHVKLNGFLPVFIDAGRDVTITADDNIGYLGVNVMGLTDERDQLGVDQTGRVKLSNGLNYDSVISVDGAVIGAFYLVNGTALSVEFNEDASGAVVQEFVRALTYSNTDGKITTAKNITIAIGDLGYRNTDIQLTVDPQSTEPPPPPPPPADPVNHAPTKVELAGSKIAELSASGTVIGTLKGIDPDAGDSIVLKLTDNAGGRFVLQGDKLVVADGAKLDFEQAASHTIVVRATDKAGLFFDQRITVTVENVGVESTSGSDGDDVFVGGGGRDNLGGGLGDDKLTGGLGNDILTGDKGRDIFVFDTGLNKKTNVDKIVDFNHRDDTIHLAQSVFSKIAKKGVLSSKAFWVGDKAHDASDRIVYNKKTGALFYDQDGNGAKAAVQFATLPKKLALAANDFFVV